MAEHGNAPFNGPETVEALTNDRMRTWSGFTNATFGVVVFVTVVLIGMAVFLL